MAGLVSTRLIIAASLVAATSVQAEPQVADSYLCITDAVAGFDYDKASDRWKATTFRPGAKYILRRSRADDDYADDSKWLFIPFGDKTFPWSKCKDDLPRRFGNLNSWQLSCSGLYELYFSAETLRFQAYYTGSYVTKDDRPGYDTPAIQIGTCSRL